ncbi:manganese efflux pump MntP family protein [Desulfovibrio litoralis]|uniref:Putative manganese efflux pump MntP n=1 Tax=Desulfovibrio litoralis DSM 11393 TaxID=1121455 RepID=A0A1M7SMK6_9BACT|nr:manganese efflux pump MntP family protein [Desulfovibrio litoralis]SHN59664.1 Putative Mn2+ efflux pump MntP [Desulfovibrio litoralis DSM 11393]
MSIIEIITIAIALALDAFAVAIATGIQLKCVNANQTIRMSLFFGGFQAVMPIIGWFVGVRIHHLIESFDHWIAFSLLTFVGVKMIYEALKKDDETECTLDNTCGSRLVMLSIATSIDALAVGLSLAVIGVDIWFPSFIIGVVCLLFTALGLHLGKIIGNFESIGKKAEVVGGLVLIGIGIKIFIE